MSILTAAIMEARRERKQRAVQRKMEKHVASIAKSLERIADAITEDGALVLAIQHFSTVVKQDVTRALNNAAFRPGRGERKKK